MSRPFSPTTPRDVFPEESTATQSIRARLWRSAWEAPALGGEKIPGFELLGRVGEGGMAVVYLAEQIEPIRREVAIKVIKPGMDSAEVIARFNLERQSLAVMNHPHIAQVYAAGMTASGRPYFAMEFVEGPPLTLWCHEQRYSRDRRLELFTDVCQAVQHAHQKSIIHRDLKPSNILVQGTAERPVPKVIDFGIAKAIQGPSTQHTIVTVAGHVVGTPLYMSPEQATGSVDVDTRSDVYALGVILYELLTGSTPFEDQRKGPLDALLKAVCETEPEVPSQRLLRAGQSSEAAAIRGDLDCIILRALEKDRERRYVSAEALAADLKRFRWHEPVLARPPSRLYRLRKVARRHWLPLSAGGAVIGALAVGMVVSVTQARVARQERDAARIARSRAERVASALRDLFSASDPTRDGREVKVVEVLGRAAAKAEAELAHEPDVLRSIRHTLAQTYYNLSDHTEAERLLRSILEADHRPTSEWTAEEASVLTDLGNVLCASGRPQEAVSPLTNAVALFRRYGADAGKLKADALVSLGMVLDQVGRGAEGERYLMEGDRTAREILGPTNRVSAVALAILANIRGHDGDYSGRCQRYREAVAMLEVLPEASLDLAAALENLGRTLVTLKEFAEAETVLNRSLALRRELFGAESLEVASALTGLADLDEKRGNSAASERTARLALDLHGRIQSSDPERILSLWVLGRALSAQGQMADAEGYLRQVHTLARANYSTNSNMYADSLRDLGDLLVKLQRWAEAETTLLQYVELERARTPANEQRIQLAKDRLVRLYAESAQPEKARAWRESGTRSESPRRVAEPQATP